MPSRSRRSFGEKERDSRSVVSEAAAAAAAAVVAACCGCCGGAAGLLLVSGAGLAGTSGRAVSATGGWRNGVNNDEKMRQIHTFACSSLLRSKTPASPLIGAGTAAAEACWLSLPVKE